MSKRRQRSSDSECTENLNPCKQRTSKSTLSNMDTDRDLPVQSSEQSSGDDNEIGLTGENECTSTNEKTLQIVSQIQSKLDNFIERLDKVTDDFHELKTDIKKRYGIEERLDVVCIESNDNTLDITQLKEQNKTLTHELDIMKSYIIRLEQRVNCSTADINNQAVRGMRNNLIVTGVTESESENLVEKVNDIVVNGLNIEPVKFDRIHRIGPKSNSTTSSPRVIVGKCFDYSQRENVLRNVKKLKGPVKIYPQFPEANREKRKRSIDVQKQYNDESVETKLVGEKLVFKGSGNVHKEKIAIPKADTVLSCGTDTKYEIVHGDVISDRENKFQAHAVEIKSIREAREATVQILRDPEIAKANHNVLSCIYLNRNGEIKDSVDDDQEYGAARKILNVMHEKEVSNMLVIVSRWNPNAQKLGPKRFDHFKNSALNVMRKLLVN